MAFDFQRALSLGRQAVRLIDTLRGTQDAGADTATRRDARGPGGEARGAQGGGLFDLGVPPRQDGGSGARVDPTDPTQCWPPAPRGGDTRDSGPAGTRRGEAGDDGSGRTEESGRSGALLPDFTGRARVEYAPLPGPAAGPGEVVWTWVPFKEMDGRGKDRPVLLVGRDGGHLLGLMLTSKDHTGAERRDEDYVDVGSGAWDRQGRPSEAKLDRILRVDPSAVRREGGVLDPARFQDVGDALSRVQGWER